MASDAIFEATGTKADKLNAEHEHIAALDAPVMSLHAAFVRSVTDGNPVLPTMLSVKIARKQRTVTGAGAPGNTNAADGTGADTHGNTYVDYTLIGACEQRNDYVRSKSALELAPLLRHLSTMTSAVMPARLSMLVHSKAHPFSIRYTTAELPCMTAWTIGMTKANS